MPGGSNIFLVGSKNTKERIMIDAGDVPTKNTLFIRNLYNYINDTNKELGLDLNNGIYISTILITHAHLDHCAGLENVLKMLKENVG